MALQVTSDQASRMEVSNPTLLQQALNHHELRSRDGTIATVQADHDMSTRKSRKMRELANNFQVPQIEITQATIARRIMQKIQGMTPEQQKDYVNNLGTSLFGHDWQKRAGGNVFLELALIQENSMSGNQAATIGRLSQEQADQNQMASMNTTLANEANTMQSDAHNAYEAEQKAEEDRHHGFWGIFAGIAAIVAIVVVAVVVGACTGGAGDIGVAAALGEGGSALGEGGAALGEGGAALGEGGGALGEGGGALGEGGGALSEGGEAGGTAAEQSGDAAEGAETAEGAEGAEAGNTSAGEGSNASQGTTDTAQQTESSFKQTLEKCASRLKGSMGRGFRTLFSDWRYGLPAGAAIAGGLGSVSYGAYATTQASDQAGNAAAFGSDISASATQAQIYTNNINMFNQDIQEQNTAQQQLSDANTAAASFVNQAAQDMQQVQSLGSMF